MSVSVLVPFRANPGSDRDRIWTWMRQRWELLCPDWELVVEGDRGDDPARFNEGQALNAAAAQASGDILVIAESEVAFNQGPLLRAVKMVERGGGWLCPAVYHQLTQQTTDRLLASTPERYIDEPVVTLRTWARESVAPIVVMPREAFDLVGGYEERIPGWGWNDKIMAAALDTLYQPHGRYPGSVLHFEHGRTESVDCNPTLTARYLRAAGDRAAMLAILAERSVA